MRTIHQKAISQMNEAHIDTRFSDLYLKVNEISEALIEEYEFKCNVKKFRSAIDNSAWFEIPFANDEYWKGLNQYKQL